METFVLVVFAALVSASGASKVVYAQEGETAVLKPSEKRTSYLYVYWKFGDPSGLTLAWRNHLGGKNTYPEEPWKNKLSMPDNSESLSVSNIQPQNFGKYICEITSKDKTAAISHIELIKLSVSQSPAAALLPGESVTLSCAVHSQQKPDIHWLNPRGERVMDRDGKVTVRVTSQHHGEWTCVVAGEKRVKKLVKVVGFSPAPSLPQYTSTSASLSVPCSLPRNVNWTETRAKGLQEVHWQFIPKTPSGLASAGAQRLFSLSLGDKLSWTLDQSRGLSPAKDLDKGNLGLARKLGRDDDRGDYVCTMEFGNGVTLNSTVHVEVLQIVPSPGTRLLSGQQLNLTCGVGHALPSDLQLEWFPPERSPLRPRQSERLAIPEVSTDSRGDWRCVLWHGDTQLTSAVIALTVESKLSAWKLAIAGIASVIVVLLLLILALTLRRRRHQKRHLRHQLCRCKHPKPKGFYRT